MATITEKFTANTTWQAAKVGPINLMINIERGFSYMTIGTTLPTDDSNAMLVKPVAGENYINISLEAGDTMYVRASREDSVLSWVAQTA